MYSVRQLLIQKCASTVLILSLIFYFIFVYAPVGLAQENNDFMVQYNLAKEKFESGDIKAAKEILEQIRDSELFRTQNQERDTFKLLADVTTRDLKIDAKGADEFQLQFNAATNEYQNGNFINAILFLKHIVKYELYVTIDEEIETYKLMAYSAISMEQKEVIVQAIKKILDINPTYIPGEEETEQYKGWVKDVKQQMKQEFINQEAKPIVTQKTVKPLDEKKKKRTVWLLAGGAILVAGVVVFLVASGKDDNNEGHLQNNDLPLPPTLP